MVGSLSGSFCLLSTYFVFEEAGKYENTFPRLPHRWLWIWIMCFNKKNTCKSRIQVWVVQIEVIILLWKLLELLVVAGPLALVFSIFRIMVVKDLLRLSRNYNLLNLGLWHENVLKLNKPEVIPSLGPLCLFQLFVSIKFWLSKA